MERRRVGFLSACIAGVLAAAGVANAQTEAYISEVFFNPAGGDDGFEFVEISATPGATLTDWYLIVLEGDSFPGGDIAGIVEQVADLSSVTVGTNGLVLLRDSSIVLEPAPDPATTVVVDPAAFDPDIENGSNTFVLFHWDASAGGTLPFVGYDMDAGDDGTIDVSLAGFETVDAVAWLNVTTSGVDVEYGDDFGGTNLGHMINQTTGNEYNAEGFVRVFDAGVPCDWAGGDTDPDALTGADPFVWNIDRSFGFIENGVPDPSLKQLDPGTANDMVCGAMTCYPDCDGSGTLNILDYICFGDDFAAGGTYADCDNSGSLNILDYICFGDAFAAGCP